MKILATFDGSEFSESILTQLSEMSALPTAEFVFLAVAHEPRGRRQGRHPGRPEGVSEMMGATLPLLVEVPEVQWAENKGQAIERRRAQLKDYLEGLATRLPGAASVQVRTDVRDDAAEAIVDCAREYGATVIVMATHSRKGVPHALFGSTTEKVVRSGVAPVLVVHPTENPRENLEPRT